MTPKLVQVKANPELDTGRSLYAYKIGVGDILRITVYNHPELTNPQGQYRSAKEAGTIVKNDGTIFFPYVGNAKVNGMTIEQVRTLIADRLTKYVESPQVDVSVADFSSKKVYVSGEVNKSGKQSLTDVPLTIVEAINNAEGITADADWEHAVYTHGDKKEIISLKSILQMGDMTQNRVMRPGDSLYVPRNDELKITVMGETGSQKTLNMGLYGMTLAEALASAGGVSRSHADASGIFVIRPTGTSKDKIARLYQLNAKDATAMIMATQFQLQPRDVVYVTTAPITRWNRVINKITPEISALNDAITTTRSIKTWP
ncbi:polysaccharide export protein [Klebsiella oxytoca]|nr:polysaccharide export protein [Klebsiella oxytoca]